VTVFEHRVCIFEFAYFKMEAHRKLDRNLKIWQIGVKLKIRWVVEIRKLAENWLKSLHSYDCHFFLSVKFTEMIFTDAEINPLDHNPLDAKFFSWFSINMYVKVRTMFFFEQVRESFFLNKSFLNNRIQAAWLTLFVSF